MAPTVPANGAAKGAAPLCPLFCDGHAQNVQRRASGAANGAAPPRHLPDAYFVRQSRANRSTARPPAAATGANGARVQRRAPPRAHVDP